MAKMSHGSPSVGESWFILAILKIQTTDPNRSSCSPYWNVLGDQILYFLEFFYYLLSNFENRWFDGPENFTVHCKTAILKNA